MIINDNDLFYTCSLLELIGRVTRQKRGAVVDILGKKVVAHIYASAETLICEPIAHTADEFIEMYRVPQGEFDNLASCKYEIPDYGTIGKVYARLIEDVAREDLIDSLFQVYASEVSDMISDYNTDFYNQSRDYIKEYYITNGDPDGIDLRIPDIRFKGFTGEWEQRKLSEIAAIVGGGTPSTSNPDYWDGDIDWYAPAEMEGQRYATGSVKKITELGLQKSSATMLPAGNTVLFTSRAGIGKMAILLRSAATNQGFQSIVLKNGYNSYYIYSMGAQIKEKAESVASGSTFLEISGKMLGNLVLSIPTEAEQVQIGNFFRNIDSLIALHERKCERLQNVKKSMLEKMFPKKGSNVPEIRFAGFTEPWEMRKLGELVDIGDIDHRMPSTVEGGIPYLMTGDFSGVNELDFSNAKLISVEDYQQLSKKIKPEKEDIIFARYASVGAVRFIDFTRDFLISYSCAIIKSGKRIVPEYLYHFLTSKEAQQQIQLGINIGSQANIGIDSMKNNIIIFMPSEAEQHIISNYLSNLDNLITLRQRELEKLKNIKKSMLEKMFV